MSKSDKSKIAKMLKALLEYSSECEDSDSEKTPEKPTKLPVKVRAKKQAPKYTPSQTPKETRITRQRKAEENEFE